MILPDLKNPRIAAIVAGHTIGLIGSLIMAANIAAGAAILVLGLFIAIYGLHFRVYQLSHRLRVYEGTLESLQKLEDDRAAEAIRQTTAINKANKASLTGFFNENVQKLNQDLELTYNAATAPEKNADPKADA